MALPNCQRARQIHAPCTAPRSMPGHCFTLDERTGAKASRTKVETVTNNGARSGTCLVAGVQYVYLRIFHAVRALASRDSQGANHPYSKDPR